MIVATYGADAAYPYAITGHSPATIIRPSVSHSPGLRQIAAIGERRGVGVRAHLAERAGELGSAGPIPLVIWPCAPGVSPVANW